MLNICTKVKYMKIRFLTYNITIFEFKTFQNRNNPNKTVSTSRIALFSCRCLAAHLLQIGAEHR
jgi:hypothetical protein